MLEGCLCPDLGSLDADKVAATLSNGMKYESLNGPSQMINRPDLGNDRTVDSVSTFYMKKINNGKAEQLTTATAEEALDYMRATMKNSPPAGGPPPGGAPGGPPPGGAPGEPPSGGAPGGPPPGGAPPS